MVLTVSILNLENVIGDKEEIIMENKNVFNETVPLSTMKDIKVIKIKVIIPINETAGIILTSGRSAKVIPIANASMLVATAIADIVLKEKSGEATSQLSENDSFIIFPPIIPRRMNAIQ